MYRWRTRDRDCSRSGVVSARRVVQATNASRISGGKCGWCRSIGEGGVFTRDQTVPYIECQGNHSVWCPDRDPQRQGPWVHVSHNGRTTYVRTVADGRWTDNLLALRDR
ncbi:DUF3892 domain-containing protein [Burkholderia anthina]|uniref:DUF3892 domain-containing protein n=1 Tax=Burkholderia anthina TaxID=179879 RepID=UPI001EF10E08|nr:DUF3892 domain-containing protein [Burkholderia anthina]